VSHTKFKDRLRDMQSAYYEWMQEAIINYRFWSLDQWDPEARRALAAEGRPALTFDRTRPILQAIIGSQITNRYQATLQPREASLNRPDRFIAQSGTTVMKWAQQVGDYEQSESLAFQDTLVTGVGALDMMISFDTDPDGRIDLIRIPWGMIGWDPASTQPNMLDAQYCIHMKWVDKEEALNSFGEDEAEHLLGLMTADDNTTPAIREGRMPYGIFSKSDLPAYNRRRDQVLLFEEQCFERYYSTRIIAPDVEENRAQVEQAVRDGSTIPRVEMFADKSVATGVVKRLAARIQSMNYALSGTPSGPIPAPTYLENFPRKVYYKSIHTNSEELKRDAMPHRMFTKLFITAFEDWSKEEVRSFMGPERQMRDPQQYSNKFLSQAVHIFTANPKGALLYEKRLFSDVAKAGKQWAMATGMIEANDGMLSNPRMKEPFRHLTTTASLRGIETLLGLAVSATPASVGISEAAFLGQAQDIRRISGEALSSLLGQQNKTQTIPMDSLRLYRKQMGRLLFSFVQEYFDEETLLRILDPEKDALFLQSFKDEQLLDEYDVIVEEAPTSPNEKQQTFQLFMETGFLTQLMQSGIPIPPALADFFPIPAEAAAQFKEVLQGAFDIQKLGMELQKMQMQQQMQQPPAPPPGAAPPQEGAAPPPEQGAPPPPQGQPPVM